MSERLLIKIDVTKLDRELFFRANSGAVYLDAVAWPNRDGLSQYGDSHTITQSRPKDDPERKMPIVGNLRPMNPPAQSSPPRQAAHNAPAQGTAAAVDPTEDDIPF